MSDAACHSLVDPRFGPIRRLVRQPAAPELPAGFAAYTADVADTTRFGLWRADPWAFGAALHDDGQARRAAIGEAIERYCGAAVPRGLRRASYHELARAGEPALDPASLVLYSPSQYAQPGFPFVRFTPDLDVRWAQGRDLRHGGRVLVPASVVYLNYHDSGVYAGEPPTNLVVHPGTAAGPSREAAERAALAELIERDAVTTWWQRGDRAVGIRSAGHPVISALLATSRPRGEIAYHLFWVPTPFGVPVVGALLEDHTRTIVTLGTACRPHPLAAARKALEEAIQLRAFSLELLDRTSAVWRAVDAGMHDRRCYKPYRADRAYLDDVRPDFRDVIDFAGHAQLYLDPRMHGYVERILAPATTVDLGDLPTAGHDSARALYLRRLEAHGLRATSVDLTTSDLRGRGLHVVRVTVPGLCANAPAAFPFLGERWVSRSPGDAGVPPRDLVHAPIPAM